jgi:predicted RNA-binding protein YlqC (UPF0109 family)
MKNLLEYILVHLVDYPEEVVVTQSGDGSHVVFNIQANPADYGRIIGKQGSMISSIRNIMMVRAIKEHVRVTVVVDSGEKDESTPVAVAPEATTSETVYEAPAAEQYAAVETPDYIGDEVAEEPTTNTTV